MTSRNSPWTSVDEEFENGAGIDTHGFGSPGPDWWIPDVDPGWNFGIVGGPSTGESSAATGDSSASVAQTEPATEIQHDVTAALDTSTAAIDWWLTPDYDDDPGWVPGLVWQPVTDRLSFLVDEIVATNPVLHEVVERASSLFDELSAHYPGIVWPPLFGDSTTPVDDTATADPATTAAGNGADGQSATSAMTYADVSAQYPGIVWPVDWYLL